MKVLGIKRGGLHDGLFTVKEGSINPFLTEKLSKINFASFIWHGIFLSLASNFMDVDTIIPSLLIKAGGTPILLGLLTAIMIGGSSLMQLVFAGYLSSKARKKNPLLLGINIRIFTLFLLAFFLVHFTDLSKTLIIFFIFLFISIFSFSGSFANVSYLDILGKSIKENKRKKFFSVKQVINSLGIFFSALLVREMLKSFPYPVNYGVLFLMAGILLLIASFGFWKIKEISTPVDKKKGYAAFFRLIPKEISKNANLKHYLLIINSLGLGISFLPFLILYAKTSFGLSYTLIGNILLFKTAGMAASSFILYKTSERFEYKKLLKFSLALGTLLPILALLMSGNSLIYQFLFIFSGIYFAIYKISINGILIEISDNKNRATYAGITGAGSLFPFIFPLIFGVLISLFGYPASFFFVSFIIGTSYFPIKNLRCKALPVLQRRIKNV